MRNLDDSPLGDITALCERIASDLRARGVPHPVAGAIALAARGVSGQPTAEFAASIGVAEEELSAAESGHTAWADFPPQLDLALQQAGLDLLAMVDLEDAYESP